MTLNPDTIYYLYSTIAQTLGAIVGVGAMVAVYRLGTFHDGRWAILRRLEPFSLQVIGDAAPRAVDLLERCEPLLKGSQSIVVDGNKIHLGRNRVTVERATRTLTIDLTTNIVRDLKGLRYVVRQETKIRPIFMKFLKANIVIIGASLGLLIVPKVVAQTPLWMGVIPLTVGAIVYCLILTMDLCRTLLPPHEE